MVVSIEYLAVVGAMLVFVFQSIFKFGKLSGKVDALDANVCFIRDYLLCDGADIGHFIQHSPIEFGNADGENVLSTEWKEKLKAMELNSRIFDDPLDTAVYLTKSIGLITFIDEAQSHHLDANTLIIASAIFYNKIHRKETGKDVDLS